MIRNIILATALLASTLSMNAQTQIPKWVTDVKISGYGILDYNVNTQKGNRSNSFNLRLGRIALDGKFLNDFAWRIQMQVNGNTSSLGTSPRLVDLFAEWQKYDFAKIKFGQFKRPFTFDNPLHPIDQGFMSVAQSVSSLSGFSDRTGEHASNGRDIGVQLQGDFLKTAEGRNLLHYQIGVFNGEGINTKDVDQQKDIIGGLWVMPVDGLRIGAFGWTGSTTRKANYTEEVTVGTVTTTQHVSKTVTLQKRRYALSAEYKKNDWTVRSEFIHSTGAGFASRTPDGKSKQSVAISSLGDQAEGCYALVIAPIIKKRLYAKARFDAYTPTGSWEQSISLYEIGIDYDIDKRFRIASEYALVKDKTLVNSNYNIMDIQLSFRF